MRLPTKAFTLIELLIVISLITAITGATIPSFVGYIKSQNVKQAREQVKSDLRSLQNNALTNSVPLGVTPTTPIFWGVRFLASSADYYYFATPVNVNASNYNTCSSYIPGGSLMKFTLPSNVFSNTNTCIIFDSNAGGTAMSNFNTTNGYGFVALRDTASTVFECIKIYSSGLITSGTWMGTYCN